MTRTKYEETFAKYEQVATSEAISAQVEQIIKSEYEANATRETKAFLHGVIDNTSLNSTDTEDEIVSLVESVNDFEGKDALVPSVAAICVYPNFVKTVKEFLRAPDVKIAAVSGAFPASQSFLEVKIAETIMAVQAGADEIDIVFNLGLYRSGNYEELVTEIEEQKAAARDAHLKVIIESGALLNPIDIQKASILSLYSGADFVKTSTGKGYPGATLEAAYIICQTLKQYHKLHGIKRGIKVSGGIRSTEEAIKYYTIIKHVLGEEWLSPELFRIGASSLVGNLQKDLGL